MSLSFLTQAAIALAVAFTGAAYVYDMKTNNVPEPIVETQIEQSAEIRTPAPRQTASVVSIPRRNGQYFAQGRVGSGTIDFLVDTGASTVALTLEDARLAGIDVRNLTYSAPVQTANGQAMAAPVVLKDVAIGGVRVRNVQALVMREGLHVSLLGMTFLGELQKVEATRDQLILRQ